MFVLPVGAVTRVLVVVGLVLVALSGAALMVDAVSDVSSIGGTPYLQMLRVDRETNNLPAWYSSGLLLLCAASLACVAAIVRTRPDRRAAAQLWLLAGTAAVMSADEEVQIHENVGTVTSTLTGIDTPWMIPAAVVVAVVAFFTRDLWRSLGPRTRRPFLVAASVYGAGVLGMELLYKAFTPERNGIAHFGFIHVEEGLEMTGAALLLRAVWLAAAPGGRLRLVASDAHSKQER